MIYLHFFLNLLSQSDERVGEHRDDCDSRIKKVQSWNKMFPCSKETAGTLDARGISMEDIWVFVLTQTYSRYSRSID